MHSRFLFLVLLFCCYFGKGAAQIYDVFSNKRLDFSNRVTKELPSLSYLKKKVEIVCNYYENRNDERMNSLNAVVKELCLNYIHNENEYVKIIRELQVRMSVRRQIAYSLRNELEIDDEDAIPQLESIDAKYISMVSGRLFLKVELGFGESISSNNETVELYLDHYYIVDLQSLKTSRLNINLTPAQKIEFGSYICARINEEEALQISLEHSENENEDDTEESEIIEAPNTLPAGEFRRRLCAKIDIADADIYWLGWGCVISFPEGTPSTVPFNGEEFQLFVSLNDAKKLLKGIPEFAFVQSLQPSVPSKKLMSREDFNVKNLELTTPPNFDEVFNVNNSTRKPKSLGVRKFRKLKNGDEKFTGKEYYTFNKKGKVLEEIVTDQNGKFYSSNSYQYTKSGDVKTHIWKGYGESDVSEIFNYDSYRNLISTESKSNYEIIWNEYFYNGSFFYKISHSNLAGDKIDFKEQMKYNGTEFCIDKICYALTKNGNINGVSSTAHTYNQMQVGRDKKDRITESYFDNDRNVHYFIYDEQDRFVEHFLMRDQTLVVWQKYIYQDASAFPVELKQAISYTGELNSEILRFEWEY